MKKGPFKMKKFSGFRSSPAKQTFKEKFDLRQASKETAKKFVEDPRIARKKTTSTLERMTKAFTNTSKQLFNSKALPVIKQGIKRVGPVGAAITAYEVAKTIPKVVKKTHQHLKKEAKMRSKGGATDLFRGPKH